MENNNILLFNDLAGYGKVALGVMIPLFSHFSIKTYCVPTALVSNTLDYGKFEILDTKNYIKNTLEVYDQLNFSFDCIATGFITSYEQAKLIYDYCLKSKKKNIKIYVDPIMGDDGHLYNGVGLNRVECMKLLISISDLIMPNMTEATYLASQSIGKNDLAKEELDSLVDKLSKLCPNDIVITSVSMNKEKFTLVKGKKQKDYSLLPYEEIPLRFPGTGDIFSTILISSIMKGNSLLYSTKRAMDCVKELIILNKDNIDKFKGIPLEEYLDVIKL